MFQYFQQSGTGFHTGGCTRNHQDTELEIDVSKPNMPYGGGRSHSGHLSQIGSHRNIVGNLEKCIKHGHH